MIFFRVWWSGKCYYLKNVFVPSSKYKFSSIRSSEHDWKASSINKPVTVGASGGSISAHNWLNRLHLTDKPQLTFQAATRLQQQLTTSSDLINAQTIHDDEEGLSWCNNLISFLLRWSILENYTLSCVSCLQYKLMQLLFGKKCHNIDKHHIQ